MENNKLWRMFIMYVPDLKSNILNIGQLLEKGYSVFMKDRVLHLEDENGRVLAIVEMAKNQMFGLDLKVHNWRSSFVMTKLSLKV